MDLLWAENSGPAGEIRLPESPRGPIEFPSRSWSASALQLSKALATPKMLHKGSGKTAATIPESVAGEEDSDDSTKLSGRTFAFASSATSQRILERIMNQSEMSELTSGRLSHSSGGCLPEGTESPPISPSEEYEDVKGQLSSSTWPSMMMDFMHDEKNNRAQIDDGWCLPKTNYVLLLSTFKEQLQQHV